MRRQAFTLIELLVVVSIIALLIAILLPSLKQARAEARRVVCMSNMRQIYLGVTYYTQDYKGHLPYRIHSPVNSIFSTLGRSGQGNFAKENLDITRRTLNRYLGVDVKALAQMPDAERDKVEMEVAHCPSDDFELGPYATRGASYAINSHHPSNLDNLYEPRKLTDIDTPNRFVLYHEVAAASIVHANVGGPFYLNAAYYHHSEVEDRTPKFNLLFGDGSVGYAPIELGELVTSEYSFEIDNDPPN